MGWHIASGGPIDGAELERLGVEPKIVDLLLDPAVGTDVGSQSPCQPAVTGFWRSGTNAEYPREIALHERVSITPVSASAPDHSLW